MFSEIIPQKKTNREGLVCLVNSYVCVQGGSIVEFNIQIDVHVHVCVRGGRSLASCRSACSTPVCIVDIMFTFMFVFMPV